MKIFSKSKFFLKSLVRDLNPGPLAYQVSVLTIRPRSLMEDVGIYFQYVLFTCENQPILTKNLRLSNTFWLYQHWVRNAYVQRKS